MVGIPGRVHAFEASPVTARFVQETKARNTLDNVIVNNLGGWSLATKKPGKLKIDCVTLDDYCEQNAIPSVSFIKIDVEGFEENVLQGAKRMLRKFKPALVVEFYAKTEEAHEKSMRVLELLKSSGYECGYEFGRILNTRYPQLRESAETVPVESTPTPLPGRLRQALRLLFGR